jgi:DNA-binding MarR family transcriptional regulator
VAKKTNLDRATAARWTFLTNHAHVLLCLAADPKATMRAVATRVGITERGVQRIIAELSAAGYLTVTRVGRRNEYEVQLGAPLRGPFAGGRTAGHLIKLAS